MSTKVATAPAHEAKQPVRSEKPAEKSEKQQAVQDDDVRLADDDSVDVKVADGVANGQESLQEETSLAGDFTFGEALAEAAAGSGSLITEAEETKVSAYSNFGGGSENTILLVGAVILLGVGIWAIADSGHKNVAPTISTNVSSLTVAEDSAGGAVTVTTADDDGDTVTVTASASHGTVTNSGGTWTYVPAADFNGTDTITFNANDGNDGTASTTVSVTVTPVSDAPAGPATQAVETDEDVAVDGSITITDADGDALTFTLDTNAAHGTVDLAADGTFTYTPDPDYFGTDSFAVTGTAADGAATQTVNVTIVSDGIDEGPAPVSIDVGTTSQVETIDASGGDFAFTDNRDEITNVVINDFGTGDVINVNGASAGDYSFGTSGDALEVVYNNSPDFTRIIINLEDPLVIDGLVFDYDSAVAAVGFEFINFG